jgi:hypothetical protein
MKKELNGGTLVAIVVGVILLLGIGGFFAWKASEPQVIDGSSGDQSGPSQPGGQVPKGAGGEADRINQMKAMGMNVPANQNQPK